MMRITAAAAAVALLSVCGCSTGRDAGAAAGASGGYGAGNNLSDKRTVSSPGLGSGLDATLPGSTQSSIR